MTTSIGMFPIIWNISVLKGVVWLLLGVEQMDIEKLLVGFSPIVLVLKKIICDTFWEPLATTPSFHGEPRPTCLTLPTLLTLTLTPHYLRTKLNNNLVRVGSVNSTIYIFQPILRSIDFLIDLWTDKLGDRDASWHKCIYRWHKCQLPNLLITWWIYQRRHRDSYQQKQIYGWWGQAVSTSNHRHQYSPINPLIY